MDQSAPSQLLVLLPQSRDHIERVVGELQPGLVERASLFVGLDKAPPFLLTIETPHREKLLVSAKNIEAHAFELLPSWPREKEKQKTQGLLLGLTNCRDSAQEKSYHEWYDQVHAADVFKSPYYWRARRYKKVHGTLPNFLALYESPLPEPQAFQQYLRWPERNPQMHPAAEVVHVWTFNWEREL